MAWAAQRPRSSGAARGPAFGAGPAASMQQAAIGSGRRPHGARWSPDRQAQPLPPEEAGAFAFTFGLLFSRCFERHFALSLARAQPAAARPGGRPAQQRARGGWGVWAGGGAGWGPRAPLIGARRAVAGRARSLQKRARLQYGSYAQSVRLIRAPSQRSCAPAWLSRQGSAACAHPPAPARRNRPRAAARAPRAPASHKT